MNHPENCDGRLMFAATDPNDRHAYEQILDILLDTTLDEQTMSEGVQAQEERNKCLIGPRRAAQITAQAVLDDWDIRSPELMLFG